MVPPRLCVYQRCEGEGEGFGHIPSVSPRVRRSRRGSMEQPSRPGGKRRFFAMTDCLRRPLCTYC